MGQEEIAYQNKDITSKVLAENFKGKTFRVYGLDLPEIREAKPTNIPAVRANELRMDTLFELEDDTVAILDYESDYDKNDKIKYLNYLTGVANRYQKEKKDCPHLRMVVIYTGDISRGQVSGIYGNVDLNFWYGSSAVVVPTAIVYGGLDYSAVFDAGYYCDRYKDLKAAYGNNREALFSHFVAHGMREGRQAIDTFNVLAYKARYTDLQKAFGENLPLYYQHYIQFGIAERRNAL